MQGSSFLPRHFKCSESIEYMEIKIIKNPNDITLCYEAFFELRPHLKDKMSFVDQIITQQKEGYAIAAVIENNEAVACIGFRMATMLAWGKILYIDDLITKERHQGKGYGSVLLKHAIEFAKQQGCDQVHLDTGFTRHAAHNLYAKHGFEPNCHHLALQLAENFV